MEPKPIYYKRRIQPMERVMACPNCGKPEVDYSEKDVVLTTYPPMYPLYCKACDHRFTSAERPITMYYEPLEEMIPVVDDSPPATTQIKVSDETVFL